MRPIAWNRKNSLFAGHDDGAINSQIATRTHLRYCSSPTCSIQSTFLPLSDS
jgi:hypothetical protein